jgi:hypothetical protein
MKSLSLGLVDRFFFWNRFRFRTGLSEPVPFLNRFHFRTGFYLGNWFKVNKKISIKDPKLRLNLKYFWETGSKTVSLIKPVQKLNRFQLTGSDNPV